ncbi:hypothetical protein Pla175_37690 [Pirellulimonas nuda]|uniref:Uncharacterized protein n=1 Tax=Pirellulimonas nuda TaxID=2528009 RepID=A0A518DFV5_9BACT|nr:PAS domain-containing protein [Pirellulimonas nuda]QDU90365.1 hypothetical protein Pla175_37690 [Pirellulimonas nuda]
MPIGPDLRRRAEALLRAEPPAFAKLPCVDVQRLVHELEVHQAELELQNQQLLEAQRAMVKSRDRFQELYDFAPFCYFTLAPDGVVTQANLMFAELVGSEPSTLVGSRMSDFIQSAYQDDWRVYREGIIHDGPFNEPCNVVVRGAQGDVFMRLDCHVVRSGDDEVEEILCSLVQQQLSRRF